MPLGYTDIQCSEKPGPSIRKQMSAVVLSCSCQLPDVARFCALMCMYRVLAEFWHMERAFLSSGLRGVVLVRR